MFLNFLARRLLFQVFVLFGVLVITFLISHVVPGDPALLLAGPRASPEVVAKIRSDLGLDRPLYRQFLIYVLGLVRGDLGTSVLTRRPVARDIAERFPATFELVTLAMLLVAIVGIFFGVVSAVYKERWVDQVTRVLGIAGASMPIFWLGLLALYLFYTWLGWVPGGGRIASNIDPPTRITGLYVIDSVLTRNWPALRSSLEHLILPVFVLSFASVASILRLTRACMLEVLNQDYIRSAQAKGLPQRRIIFIHALRNALLPTITVLGVTYGELLQGAVVTETLFSWPGMARYAVSSMTYLDYPAIMALTLVSAVIYTLINLLVDVLYGAIDPRVRYD
ncbi:MAG: ABC transporter permease [Candidatus Hadarchaeum sp.]|uniref:ABC transporter permease n=1 Tax=Candidatus Hadarchaeum sp. TaxID=2883567 RepID=UPI0031816A5B